MDMIRPVEIQDLDQILSIYERARAYMRETGNPTQWGTTSPALSVLLKDIELKQLYLLEDQRAIHAVFALIPGDDPTYKYIEGEWLSDAPYAAIHRVASAGLRKGVLGECFAFCKQQHENLRIDTHHDNKIMQHLLDKHGFQRCGIIYLENGDPRIAYQLVP
jgi:RimJ/RimL family protein N-acetyltransferase